MLATRPLFTGRAPDAVPRGMGSQLTAAPAGGW